MVANKVRTPRDEETVREFAGRHGLPLAGVVPFDDAVITADQQGAALIEYQPAAPSVTAIRRLAEEVLSGDGAGRRGR